MAKTRDIYIIIYRKEYRSDSYADLTQTASALKIHVNTLRNRLTKGYYFDDNHIVMLSTFHYSERGKQ